MDYLKLFSYCLLVILLFSILPTYPDSCNAGSISIEGEVGRIKIDGVDVDKIESININSNTNSGCVEGSGVKRTDKRKTALFNKIDISGTFDVNIECQKEQCVEVVSDDNILPYIITEVKDNTMFATASKSICPKAGLELNISVDDIEMISVDGANDIIVTRIDNEGLTIDLDGAGDIKASGKTGEFVTNITGAIDLNAKELKSEKVRISVDGASDSYVYASKRLQVGISGVGDIYYYGNPEEVVEDISGVGELIKGE